MNILRRRLFLTTGVFAFLILLGTYRDGWTQGQPVSFSATGDIPYGTGEIPTFQQQINDQNLYSPSAFFVHVGDINAGSESCADARYALVANMLKGLATPAYIVPGDNETTDCSNPAQGLAWWLQYFTNFEQNFCGAPFTEHQSGRVQNFAFVLDGVLFIGLDLVGSTGTSSSNQQKDADWVDQQFSAKVSQVRAAVVFAQAGPGSGRTTFFDQFEASAGAFAKPVLFLHGDGHKWIQNNPWSTSNTMRIQVDNGGAEDPVQITVTSNTSSPSNAFSIKRNPFNGAQPYNTPPCVNAGSDQSITSASTTLQGSVTDDSDPGSSLSTVWSLVSGPGAVTFGNTNSLSTSASFGASGVYILRLTANDGPWQKNDDVTIAVNTTINHNPVISSFTPTSGPVGTGVTISGSNFSGTTNVAFNGTTASFSVNSDAQISATVPNGATTGKISVTNADGIGQSATNFIVTTTPTQYTLSTNVVGSGSVALNPTGGTYNSGTVVTLTATPAAGFQFSGWSGDLSGSTNPATITMNANKNVTATFTALPPTQYTLSTNVVGSGSVALNPTGGTYNSGTVVTLTATPAAGFQFSGWSGDLSGSTNPATITMNANKNVTATFTTLPPNQYTLSTNVVGSGSIALNPTGGTYNSGTVVTLTATPAAGFQFSGWSGDLSGSTNPATITMNANKNVTATFTALPPTQYTLNVNVVGSGSVALNPTGGTYNAGTIVTLTAEPSAGWSFDGWSGDLNGFTNPATITMNANANVTANFIENSTGGGGLVVYEETKTGGSSGSTTVTSASLTAVSGHLYLAAITAKANTAVSSVSGLGLNWTRVRAQCSGRDQTGVEIWRAIGTPSGNGPVTATFAAAPSNATIAVVRYSNVNAASPIGNIVSGNSNGTNGTCSGGTDNAAYSLSFSTTTDGAMVFAAAAMRSKSNTPGAGYTERADFIQGSGGSTASVAVQDQGFASAGGALVNGTFSGSTDWAVVGVEIKPGGGGATQHTLTVNTSGSGSVSLNPSAGTYDSGTVVTLTATPAAGFQFAGWSGDLTGSTNPATITMVANKNVTATFTAVPPNQYTLTANVSGSGSVGLNPSGGTYDSGTVVTLTATPAAGFQFAGWSGDLTGSTNPATITMDANKNVTATFTAVPPNQYTLTANVSGSGSVGLNPSGGTYDSGTVVTLTATPAAGFQFAGWSGDLTGSTNPATITMDANKNVTATFTAVPPNQYTLTANVSGSGSVELNPSGGTYDSGTVVTLTATPAAGFQFAGWSGDLTGSTNPATITMDANKNVTATFTAVPPNQYTLTANVSGSGSVALNPLGGTYDSGTVVTLTATPASGFQFAGWSGDLTGSTNPATITMDANKNVTATFTAVPPVQYTLTANVSGSGSVALNPLGGTYDSDTVVTLTATPAAGFQFAGWSGDLTGSTNPATITMDANKNVTATFTAVPPVQYTLTANVSGSGSVGLNPSGGTYDSGTVVTLTATPSAGFQFAGWSGDLTGSTNPATITMDANKIVTATFTPSGGSGQVVYEETQTGGSSSSTTVTTSSSLTGVSGHLYLAAIASKSYKNVSAVTGLGLTWTLVKAQCAGRSQTGVDVWMAKGTPSGNGTVTATFSATPSSAVIAVSRYSGVGVNAIGNLVSGNTNGVNGACDGGVDNSVYAFNLTTTTNGAMVYQVAALRSKTLTPGAGYNSRTFAQQGSGGSMAAVAVLDQSVATAATVAVDGSISGAVDWAVVAVEIKPQITTTLSKHHEGAAPATGFALEPSDPNPFNGSTTINFSLPVACNVDLSIYAANDQIVRTLASGEMAAGHYSVSWNGNDEFNHSVPAGEYFCKIDIEDEDGKFLFAQTQQLTMLPSTFQLDPNYPNPFSVSTHIRFVLPQASQVTIKVYALNGTEVKTLVNAPYPAGAHAVVFKPNNLPSGSYFFVMQAGDVRQVRRLLLVK